MGWWQAGRTKIYVSIVCVRAFRVEYNGMFGGKINKQVQYPEFINMRPYMSVPKVSQ